MEKDANAANPSVTGQHDIDTAFSLLGSGLNLIEQGITIFDRDLRLVHGNRRFLELYDLPRDFLRPGTSFERIIRFVAESGDFGPGNVDDLVRERVDRAMAFEDHYMERTRPNGVVVAVEGHALANGGWVAVYTDITSRKRHEEDLHQQADRLSSRLLVRSDELAATNRELFAVNRALEETKRQLLESEGRMRTIAQSVPAHIAYVDRERTYRYSNNFFTEILGHDADALMGRRVNTVFEADIMKILDPAIDKALGGSRESVDLKIHDRDGAIHHVRTTLVPDWSDDGEVHGFHVLSLDITEEKRAMDLLVHSKRMEAATQLTSGVVHDFSNILTIIRGNLDRLADECLEPADRQRIIAITQRAVERGGRVTDQLVSFSRNEELHPAAHDVGRLTHELTQLFAASLDPDITLDTDGIRFGVGMYADENGFQDALLNLLLNARDAVGHRGRISVSAESVDIEGTSQARISVQDNGCGFREGTIERACDAFFSTKQEGRGRGLGLSMVRRFVLRTGGELLIDSEPGKGASITMLLPGTVVAGHQQRHTQAGTPSIFDGGLVLVVDDEPEIRTLVRDQLTRAGASVIEAVESLEAVDLVRQIPQIELIVSDIMLGGGLNGLDTCRQIRRDRPRMPVLMMSGLSASHPAFVAAQREFPLLAKPFSSTSLMDALSRLRISSSGGRA